MLPSHLFNLPFIIFFCFSIAKNHSPTPPNPTWEYKATSSPMMMAGFKYWEDCILNLDMEAMWLIPDVSSEWESAGETRGHKVRFSRDPQGQPYLTQTEMRAVAEITVRRHFASEIDADMLCVLAELESDRQLLATRHNEKTKDSTVGIMQILPKTAMWLHSEQGYCAYEVSDEKHLYRPFENVYFAAAYLKCLSEFGEIERGEEFVVRAYKGGTKKATHKSTMHFWKRYLSVKETYTNRKPFDGGGLLSHPTALTVAPLPAKGAPSEYWNLRTSHEDMEDMWTHPEILKEWSTKSSGKLGKVRFSLDSKKRPYLSRVEVRAVAEIILLRHFASRKVKVTVLCALAEVASRCFVNGIGGRVGLMGIDFPTASWLHNELGYKAYDIESVDDLCKPFVSMYFGAAYLAWLSEYEGREQTPQFVVQAYLGGPKSANSQDKGPLWLKFEEALRNYGEVTRDSGSCSIL
ncbi:hypothetical protein MLD38_027052 [Melastoma candidum]|uniref:Uncharacterized protein n=1 Tax=Melastoma candidum TaxID=119954 RepID=A0ACB9P5A3_9MYRT|nr:hypothetical protein MLD38_027052 [Melastoma candidum]